MKWTQSETIKLVELYKKHECLWNSKDPDYKNKTIRDEAYKEIVEQMSKENFYEFELKQRLKNLRTLYHKEVIKIKEALKKDEIHFSSLKWFPIMDSFMQSMRCDDETQIFDFDIKNESSPSDDKSSVILSPEPRSTCHYVNENDCLDENEAFGQYVTSVLNKLPSKQCLLAQRDIQNILIEYRLADEQSDPIDVDTRLHKYQADSGRDSDVNDSIIE